jgi:hypothetical protein
MGFGLVIGFIGHFNAQLVTTFYISISHRLVLSVTVFTALLSNVLTNSRRSSAPRLMSS